ncbi:MAG: hypothetical protein ACK5IB_10485 [Qingshengfaniella sp.]
MNRTELIGFLALALFGAFLVGFALHWLIMRLSRVSHAELGELDQMAEALHDAEEARDHAIAERNASETRLNSQLVQSQAELRGAMEGLRDARAEAEELRAYLSEQNLPRG